MTHFYKLVFLFFLLVITNKIRAQEPDLTRWLDTNGLSRSMHTVFDSNLPFIVNLIQYSPPSQPQISKGRICLIVNDKLLETLDNLDLFQEDLNRQGYETVLYSYQSGSARDLRTFLFKLFQQPQSLVGSILIGHLPYVIYEMEQQWETEGEPYEDFPCDIYFMDLDGEWLDTKSDNSKYDKRAGNLDLEIWTSRIKTDNLPALGREDHIVDQYFNKVHLFRSGQLLSEKNALLYIDDDWTSMLQQDRQNISHLYAKSHITTVADPEITTAENYKNNHLTGNYEFIHVRSHGNSFGHSFYQNSGSVVKHVKGTDYLQKNPSALFFSFYVCSGADFTFNNYLSGLATFNTQSSGLFSWGSSKMGGMWNDEQFYSLLKTGKSFGSAFVDWFNSMQEQNTIAVDKWWYGMVLVGDATLSPNEYKLFSLQNSIDLESISSDNTFGQIIDLDKDGDLDIFRMEESNAEPEFVRIYENAPENGMAAFRKLQTAIPPSQNPIVISGDFDSDGYLDLILSAKTMDEHSILFYRNIGPMVGQKWLYQKFNTPINDIGSINICQDFDNDGDLDILTTGFNNSPKNKTIFYRNEGQSQKSLWGFTRLQSNIRPIQSGQLFCHDLDHDQDMDIISEGRRLTGKKTIDIYLNQKTDSLDWQFQKIKTNIPLYNYSDLSCQDYDMDGDPDLIMTGVDADHGLEITRLLINQGLNPDGALYFKSTPTNLPAMNKGQLSWGDYNNDGKSDVLVSGTTQEGFINKLFKYENQKWYEIFDLGTLGKSFFYDIDADDRLDILVIEEENNDQFISIYANKYAKTNMRPNPPTDLHVQVNKDMVFFKWNGAIDNETPVKGLRYNLRVGNHEQGENVLAPYPKHIGGNVGTNKQWVLKNLKPGVYYCSVQTIDGLGCRSDFSIEKQFTISPDLTQFFNIRLLLEGFYQTLNMNCILNEKQSLPHNSPYELNFRFDGTFPAQICDWIYLSLKKRINDNAIASKSLFLRNDGYLISPDDFGPFVRLNIPSGNYYLVIEHRNHLQSISVKIQTSPNDTLFYDFTLGNHKYYNPSYAIELDSGVWGTKAGDIDQDGQLTRSDFDSWLYAARRDTSMYPTADIDGDGFVTARDYMYLYNNLLRLQ